MGLLVKKSDVADLIWMETTAVLDNNESHKYIGIPKQCLGEINSQLSMSNSNASISISPDNSRDLWESRLVIGSKGEKEKKAVCPCQWLPGLTL